MRQRLSRINLFLIVLGLLFGLLLVEISLRSLFGKGPALQGVRNHLYAYDQQFGWLPVPGSSGEYYGYRRTMVRHNQAGFRDREHGPKKLPRIAFFGDSFVWGYDSEVTERFSDRLQASIPNWDVLNFGISGFGTDQEYLLLQKIFGEYQPDIVVLVFTGHNDFTDNSSNVQAVYMKPYFRLDAAGGLSLEGVPVPKTWVYYFQSGPLKILRNSKIVEDLAQLSTHLRIIRVPDPTFQLISAFRAYVEQAGSKFLLALVDDTPRVLDYCEKQGIECLGLANAEVYPSYGKHWNVEGNALVAQRLEQKLKDLGWLVGQH